MNFHLERLRMRFRALETARFDPQLPENSFRGAFGMLLPEGHFAPRRGAGGPSGLRDAPRPFVLRATSLAGRWVEPGELFEVDAHVFDTAGPLAENFRAGAERLMRIQGARIEIDSIDSQPFAISLAPTEHVNGLLEVRLVSPTELKAAEWPEFAALWARVRDRIANLSRIYGSGPPEIDFPRSAARARAVRLAASDLSFVDAVRRSSRTGQTHPIGGWTGKIVYEGNFREFYPWLRAAWWTGVGRQTVWGKGVIEVKPVAPAGDCR